MHHGEDVTPSLVGVVGFNVGLFGVAGYEYLAVVSYSGKEHLQLGVGCVLCLVKKQYRVLKGISTHVSKGLKQHCFLRQFVG